MGPPLLIYFFLQEGPGKEENLPTKAELPYRLTLYYITSISSSSPPSAHHSSYVRGNGVFG